MRSNIALALLALTAAGCGDTEGYLQEDLIQAYCDGRADDVRNQAEFALLGDVVSGIGDSCDTLLEHDGVLNIGTKQLRSFGGMQVWLGPDSRVGKPALVLATATEVDQAAAATERVRDCVRRVLEGMQGVQRQERNCRPGFAGAIGGYPVRFQR